MKLQVENLTKSYGPHQVLKGLSFHVGEGEIFALLGVNGAGKTTALECMEGLRRYDSGRITLKGKMGIQLQSGALPDHIKPLEAVKLFAKWNKTQADCSMLDSLGIYGLAKKQYCRLSTGQKRRLHLALALIGDPDIVFLDEPTAGLDVEGRISLHEEIRKLKARGKTIVLASHDMAEVESLCDRIAVLSGGSLVFIGSVEELSAKISKSYIINVKTDRGDRRRETGNLGETMLNLLEELRQQGAEILDISIDKGSFEQHFMEMVRGNNQ